MKLWHAHMGWDYHGQAGWVVIAASAASAAKKLNAHLRKEKHWTYKPDFTADAFVELTNGIYEDLGCDD